LNLQVFAVEVRGWDIITGTGEKDGGSKETLRFSPEQQPAYRFRQGILRSTDRSAGFKKMMKEINEAVGKYRGVERK
jgi:hypothetical protein